MTVAFRLSTNGIRVAVGELVGIEVDVAVTVADGAGASVGGTTVTATGAGSTVGVDAGEQAVNISRRIVAENLFIQLFAIRFPIKKLNRFNVAKRQQGQFILAAIAPVNFIQRILRVADLCHEIYFFINQRQQVQPFDEEE